MGVNLRISVTMSHLMAIGPLLLLNLSVSAQGVSTLAAWLNTYCPDCIASVGWRGGDSMAGPSYLRPLSTILGSLYRRRFIVPTKAQPRLRRINSPRGIEEVISLPTDAG
jgi:hypothetical protein